LSLKLHSGAMSLFPYRIWRLAAVSSLACLAAPIQAQPAPPRTLEVPANVSWQHAETELILPPQSAGLRRTRIRDNTADELDIVADYADDLQGTIATVFLFKTAVPDVALWFDRALTAIMLRPGWNLQASPMPAGIVFARPGASAASALRTSVDVGVPGARSSALAVVPLGPFLAKVRISSDRLDRSALDALMIRFIEGLQWPTASAGEAAAVPIEPCAAPMRLRRARVVRDDMAQVLGNLITGAAAARRTGPGPVYCREPGPTLERGVYRPGGSSQAYVIALGDAGVLLSLGQALDMGALLGNGGRGRTYSMTLLDRESTGALPSFSRLPPPDQAIAVAFGSGGPTLSATTRDPN